MTLKFATLNAQILYCGHRTTTDEQEKAVLAALQDPKTGQKGHIYYWHSIRKLSHTERFFNWIKNRTPEELTQSLQQTHQEPTIYDILFRQSQTRTDPIGTIIQLLTNAVDIINKQPTILESEESATDNPKLFDNTHIEYPGDELKKLLAEPTGTITQEIKNIILECRTRSTMVYENGPKGWNFYAKDTPSTDSSIKRSYSWDDDYDEYPL